MEEFKWKKNSQEQSGNGGAGHEEVNLSIVGGAVGTVRSSTGSHGGVWDTSGEGRSWMESSGGTRKHVLSNNNLFSSSIKASKHQVHETLTLLTKIAFIKR